MIRFILIMLVFALDGWSVCSSGDFYIYDGSVSVVGCTKPLSSFCSHSPSQSVSDNNYYYAHCSAGSVVYCGNSSLYWNCHTGSGSSIAVTQSPIPSGCGGNICASLPFYAYCTARCSTKSEADSLGCEINPDGDNCVNRCDVYHQQCDQLGGVFTGHQTQTGCAASCNTCGNTANSNIMDIKIASCCSQGLAPSVDKMCWTPDIATGDGMQVSTNANLDCVDPSLDDENLNLYVTYCYEQDISSSSVESSADAASSGGGGSSGEDAASSGGGVPGEQIDYYPILDTIRDTLIDIKRNVNTITTCLLTPGACAGLNPQVNVTLLSDSAYIKSVNNSINVQTDLIDSSLKNGNERLRNAIASANDTLIDSLRKFMSSNASGDTLHNIHNSIIDIASNVSFKLGYGDTASSNLRDDLRSYFTGVSVDTGSVGFANNFVLEGENLADSIGRAVGWLGGVDGLDVDSVYGFAGGLDSLAVDSIGRAVDDSLGGLADSLNGVLVSQIDSIKGAFPDSLDSWSDSLIAYSPFASFDSLIFGQLGAKIPNSNQCPEDCQKWQINSPRFGLFSFTVDYGLCLGRLPFGGMSALGFVRLLLRIITVWSCIWLVFNGLTRRKD